MELKLILILLSPLLLLREKLFLVKTTSSRLEAIGKGRAPDLSSSFLDRMAPANPKGPPLQGRVGGPMAPRLTGAPGGQVRGSAPRAAPLPPQVVTPPRQLAANSSISISKVSLSSTYLLTCNPAPAPGLLLILLAGLPRWTCPVLATCATSCCPPLQLWWNT